MIVDIVMNSDTQYEDSVSVMVLENIKNKLLHAFRTSAEPRTSAETENVTPPIGKSFQVNEELRRAKIDGAITWLRSELVSLETTDVFTSSVTVNELLDCFSFILLLVG